jgi:hypothetical protein
MFGAIEKLGNMSTFSRVVTVWGIVVVGGAIAVGGALTSFNSTPAVSNLAPAAPTHQTPIHLGYDEAARYPERHIGKAVVFSGKVVQVLDEGKSLLMRVAVTKDEHGWWKYDDIVLLRYRDPLKNDGRILDNDIVEFRGIFKGIQKYSALFGQNIEKPGVTACDVRVISNPNPRAPRDCT